jgi:hypothetical protein
VRHSSAYDCQPQVPSGPDARSLAVPQAEPAAATPAKIPVVRRRCPAADRRAGRAQGDRLPDSEQKTGIQVSDVHDQIGRTLIARQQSLAAWSWLIGLGGADAEATQLQCTRLKVASMPSSLQLVCHGVPVFGGLVVVDLEFGPDVRDI